MLMLLMNLLSNPRRSLRTLVLGIAVTVILLVALGHATPAFQETVGGILIAALALSVIVRVPMRYVLPLTIGAVVIVTVLNLVTAVIASGYVPLIMIGLGLMFGLSVWFRSGAPGLRSGSLGDAIRRAFRQPPQSRGAHWASVRELQRGGFLGESGWPLGEVDGHILRLPMEREREGIPERQSAAPG